MHRDITPRNVLRLAEAEGSRWVVSDWGLVRRPQGMTSTLRTVPGQPFGTQGFVAPEVANDGHVADARADVYSLGRVLGFALTGQLPSPNLPQDVQGRWRHFVQRATHADARRRIKSMADLRVAIAAERVVRPRRTAKTPVELASELDDEVERGNTIAVDALLDLALSNPDDPELWLDHLAQAPRDAVAHAVRDRRAELGTLVDQLLQHTTKNWGGRSFDSMNRPLQRLLWIAEEALLQEDWGLLEDASRALFIAEVHCKRFAQRTRSQKWLGSLDGQAAETVARALSSTDGAAQWYMEEGWRPSGTHPAILAALH